MRVMAARRSVGVVALVVCVAGVPAVARAQSGERRLADAAKDADWGVVRALLEQGADVGTPQGDGTTALHWASYWDDADSADLLIRAGADVDAANDLGVTPLWTACENGSAAMVERLLQAGASPNAALLSGETLLMMAAHTGNAEIIEQLLVGGAEADATERARGQTALMWAVGQHHADVVEVLLAHDADVHARSTVWTEVVKTTLEPWNHPDYVIDVQRGGYTALLFAARVDDLVSAKRLVAAGADVNDTAPYGTSATVVAAHSGHGELAAFLLEQGADPDAAGAGYTALHAAILHKDDDLVRALLAHGADPNLPLSTSTPTRRDSVDFYFHPSFVGATPFWLAARFGAPEIMYRLAEHGADPRFVHHPSYYRGALSLSPNPLIEEGATTALMAAVGMGGRAPLVAVERLARIAEAAPVGGRRGPDAVEQEAVTLEAVRLATVLGVDVNTANADGDTALHAAAARGYDTVIEVLVENGATLNVTNNEGRTPLALAMVGSRRLGGRYAVPRKSTVDLLRALGATE